MAAAALGSGGVVALATGAYYFPCHSVRDSFHGRARSMLAYHASARGFQVRIHGCACVSSSAFERNGFSSSNGGPLAWQDHSQHVALFSTGSVGPYTILRCAVEISSAQRLR